MLQRGKDAIRPSAKQGRVKQRVNLPYYRREFRFCEVTDKNGAKVKKFYIRSGNSSQELDIEETASYIKSRF